MALSDTALRILTEAAQHPLRLAAPPDRLPAAACRAVLNSLLKQGYVEECEAPQEYIGLGWRQDEAGTGIALRITGAGLQAIGENAAEGIPEPSEIMPALACSESPAAAAPDPVGDSGEAAEAPGALFTGQPLEPSSRASPWSPLHGPAPGALFTGQHGASVRPSLRAAAQSLVAAWDTNDGLALAAAMDALRSAMPMRAMAPRPTGPRPPRQGTKQQQVLAMLRRPEGATVAQIMGATGWQPHTVRGFLGGLARKGITIEVLERVRQVGPNKTGAKGSYSIYHIAEAD